MLQRLEGAQGLVHAAAEGEVVDGVVLHDALLVDDEETAERDAVLGEDVVGGGDLLLEVGDEGVVDVAEAAGVTLGLNPGEVGELESTLQPRTSQLRAANSS